MKRRLEEAEDKINQLQKEKIEAERRAESAENILKTKKIKMEPQIEDPEVVIKRTSIHRKDNEMILI